MPTLIKVHKMREASSLSSICIAWVVAISRFESFAFSFLDGKSFPSLQHQIVSIDPLPDITNLIDNSLEVGSGIVGTGDEDVVGLTRGCGSVQRRDRNEPR